MAVARHRQNHIERPAKAIVEAANKGRDAREEREQLVAAAEQGDIATAFLSLERIARRGRGSICHLAAISRSAHCSPYRTHLGIRITL
jgi:hypothetical protein